MVERVIWRELVAFDRPATGDPDDHGDQPYDPGDSLMDRDRRGHLRVKHSTEWIGGLRFEVSDTDSDDPLDRCEVMLDRQQVYMLTTALLRYLAGTVAGWAREPFGAHFPCRECDGLGFKIREL